MRFSQVSRLLTVSLLAICGAYLGVALFLARGVPQLVLWRMANHGPLNLLVLVSGLVLLLWGLWGLARRVPTPLESRGWDVARVTGGLFAALALGAFVLNPGQLMNLFQQDYSDPGRVQALPDADLGARTATLTADWPQWLGPNRDGRSTETGLHTDWKAKRPPEVWRKPLGGGYSSMIVVNGLLYTMDRQGTQERVVCLDTATGQEVWTLPYAADYSGLRAGYTEGPRATPAFHDGRLYTVGATGLFHCLAVPEKGQPPRVLWRHDLLAQFQGRLPTWGVACSPLIDGNLVIVQPGGADGSVAAFDHVSGELRWKALADRPGYSSPVAATLAGVRQIICFTGERVVGLQASDGKELWSYAWATQYDCNAATPLIIGKCVFISSGYNKGCALLEIQGDSPDTLKAVPLHVRLRKLMRNHHSNSVLHEGHLYGFDEEILRCFNVRTFEQAWFSRTPEKGCLIYADGHFIVLTQQGTLALVEAKPQGCTIKGQFELFQESQTWAFPTLSQGRLYARSNREIVCLDLRK